jgi:hypothetical protein
VLKDEELLSLFKQLPRYEMKSERAVPMVATLQKIEQQELRIKRQQLIGRRFRTWMAVAGVLAMFMVYFPFGGEEVLQRILFRVTTTTLPEVNDTKQVEKTLEKLFSYYPELRAYQLSRRDTGSIIEIHLKKPQSAAKADIRVETVTGKLLSFHWDISESPARISNAGNDQIARSFMEAIRGTESGIDFSNPQPNLFQRVVNGIPVQGEWIDVLTDQSGRVISYQDHMEQTIIPDSHFPGTSDVLPVQQLASKLSSEMRLVYVESVPQKSPQPHASSREAALIYTPGVRFPDSVMFDAKTGAIRYSSNYDRDFARRTEPLKVSSPRKTFTVKNKAEAADLLRTFGYPVKNSNELKRQEAPARNAWMYFIDFLDGPKVYADRDTGALLYVGGQPADKPVREPSLSMSEAEKIAIRQLEPYLDPGVSEVQMAHRQYTPEAGTYSFYYLASYKGVPVVKYHEGDLAYSVTIDATTGEPRGFTRGDVPYQLLTNMPVRLQKPFVISKEEAATIFLKESDFRLVYMYEGTGIQRLPRLVYVLTNEQPVRIDATTGSVITK